jgi:hypothetical protein
VGQPPITLWWRFRNPFIELASTPVVISSSCFRSGQEGASNFFLVISEKARTLESRVIAASYPFGPPPSVNDYSGTFNSTLNPLLLAPTISIELGQNASSKLSGGASITNSPCLTSLTLTGQAIGDALSLTDATAKVSVIALPNLAAASSFNFSYKFDPTAASCPGDFGQGVVTINLPLWDY